MHLDASALFYQTRLVVGNVRHLSDAVQAHFDAVIPAAACDLNQAALTISYERCHPKALERVAKLPPRW